MSNHNKNMGEFTFKEVLDNFRKELKDIAKRIKATKEYKTKCEVDGTEDRDEELANLTLAYRHLEDASMRIGKTLQALAGGDSIYDNNAVGTPDDSENRCQSE